MPESRYEGYIFDLDGTIYLGDALIPGAALTIERLRSNERRMVFLSNKPLEGCANYAAKLTRLGIPACSDDVINSSQALIHLLRDRHPGARVLAIAEHKLLDELAEAGFEVTQRVDIVDVVVAAFDRTLDYTKLNLAHQALVRGAHFYATNGDKTCPVEGGEIPDCAGVIAFLEATTGRIVQEIAGKPSPHILKAALARLQADASRCLMVGDRLDTDITMGVRAGMDTALVLSGVTSREMLAETEIRPTYVLESVADCP